MESAKPTVHALKPRLRAVPNAAAIRVFLVEPHTLLRYGLKMLFAAEGDIEIVGEAERALAGAIDELSAAEPDVVLMDVAAPGADGVAAIRAIRARCAGAQVLVLTAQSFRTLLRDLPGLQLKVLDAVAERLPQE